ncbi:WYL domain-containing protein [Ligilactobacillus salivarius]|nr:WYL domain-containing protein [Ligilactobacillus salivarius]
MTIATTSATRQLYIYQLLASGAHLSKKDIQRKFSVDARTVQRDFASIRNFMSEYLNEYELEYDTKDHTYYLKSNRLGLSKSQCLVLIKVLLASRSLSRKELDPLISSLLALLTKQDQKDIKPIIQSELDSYVELRNLKDKQLLAAIYTFSKIILQRETITIEYTTQRHKFVTRTIAPIALTFSDYYFYVVSYNRQFKKKKFQLMYPGKMITIQFEYTGIVEAALDKFPISRTIKKIDDHTFLLEVTTYDTGALMWFLSQKDMVTIVNPPEFRQQMKDTLQAMLSNYED